MGGFASIVRGGLAGLNEAAGNPQTAANLEAANERARQARDAELRAKLMPHAIAIRGLQERAEGLDPVKDSAQLADLQNQVQQNLQAVRGILYPESVPRGTVLERGITDPLHITSSEKRVEKAAAKRTAASAEDEAQAKALLTGAVPYTQTPQYQNAVDLLNRKTEADIRVTEARLAAVGWTRNGNPIMVDDGTGNKQWMQPFVNKMGETMMSPMPPGYMGPNVKPAKGNIVKSAQSPTGWAQTYVDAMNPNKIVAWQPAEPPRFMAGTQRTSTITDPFGVTSTTSSQMTPMIQGEVDLSGAVALPAETPAAAVSPAAPAPPQTSASPAGGPQPPAPALAGSRQLKATRQVQTGGAKQLDAQGHIPANAGNPQLVQAANSILDGMDVDKLPLPQRDRAAAMALATEYGWKGQGLFTPREVLQLKEGATVIEQLINSKSLDVLDRGTIANLPMLGQASDPAKEGFWGRLTTSLSSRAASPEQQEFLRYWRQLDALAVGLRALVQTGRATQAQVDRLIAELPNPYNTTSSEDARDRLRMVENELKVAANTGKLPDMPFGGSDPAVDQFLRNFSGSKQ